MVSVTALPRSRPLMAADLDTLPDDGHRYELVDGTLVVTPAPSLRHQLVSSRLHGLLDRHCPADLVVLAAPTDVRLAEDSVLQPDLLVVERSAIDRDPQAVGAPLLVVEIISPNTRLVDLELKRSRYEAARCPSYWVVDPDALTMIAWEWRSGGYTEIDRVAGDGSHVVTRPFPVEVVPARLVR